MFASAAGYFGSAWGRAPIQRHVKSRKENSRSVGPLLELAVGRTLGDILHDHPGEVIDPNEGNKIPGQRRDEQAEATEQGGDDLGRDDRSEEGWRRVGLAPSGSFRARDEQHEVAANDKLKEEERLQVCGIELDYGLADIKKAKALHDRDAAKQGGNNQHAAHIPPHRPLRDI